MVEGVGKDRLQRALVLAVHGRPRGALQGPY